MRSIALVLFLFVLNACVSQTCKEGKCQDQIAESTIEGEQVVDIKTLLVAKPGESCATLSDTFCESLWSSRYRGNVDFPSGRKIRMGYNRSDLISEVQLADYRALIASACDLPEDLRSAIGVGGCDKKSGKPEFTKIMKKLIRLLETVDSPQVDRSELTREAWRDGLQDFETEFGRAVRTVSTKRSYRENPSLKTKRWHHQNFEEKRTYFRHRYDLSTQIMTAKYSEHDNWKLIERIFLRVQKDVASFLQEMDLPQDYKNKMLEQVNTVQLSLPFRDPRLLGADKNCATKEQNAFYDNYWHKFTVCVGFIHSIPVEIKLYETIAHEISHSFDPQRMSQLALRETEAWKNLMRVRESNSQLACGEWQKIKQNLKLPQTIFQLPKKLVQLNQCLVDRSNIEPLTVKKLVDRAIKDAFQRVDSHAGDQWFSSVVNNEVIRAWKKVRNPSFMDGHKKISSEHSRYLEVKTPLSWPHIISSFIQEYKCQGIDPETSLVEERKKAFHQALQETNALTERLYAFWYSFEGMNSKKLAKARMARSADEAFSDWIATQLVNRYIKDFATLAEKRENIFASTAMNCSYVKAEEFIKGFKEIERRFSSSPYPTKRRRRLRQITPVIAQEINCQPAHQQLAGVKSCTL